MSSVSLRRESGDVARAKYVVEMGFMTRLIASLLLSPNNANMDNT
jgi:hypothetical protein